MRIPDCKIENGKLSIDLYVLLNQLSTKDKLKLADYLACMEDVIEYVASQIVTGYTPEGSSGYKGFGLPNTALEKAQDYIASNWMNITSYHLRALKHQLTYEMERNQKHISKQVELEGMVCRLRRTLIELTE